MVIPKYVKAPDPHLASVVGFGQTLLVLTGLENNDYVQSAQTNPNPELSLV